MIPFIICSIIAFGIGFGVGDFYKKRTDKNIKDELKALKIENRQLLKSDKKDRKDADKFKKQLENWKQKYEELNSNFETETSAAKATVEAAETELKDLTEANMKLEASRRILEGEKERAESKFENLNTRYKADLEDLKEWRSDKNKFDSHLKDYKSKLKLSGEQVAKLKALNEKQAAAVVNAHEVTGKIRMLNAQLKKYKDDLKYWEKKHYDVNHELTKYKKVYGEVYHQHEDLKKEVDGYQNSLKEMEAKVADYKTRFVTANKGYHELLREKGEFGKV